MIDDDRTGDPEARPDFGLETAIVSNDVLNGRSRETGLARLAPEPAWLLAATDALHAQPFELSELWQGLCDGTWQFRDTFSSPERHFGVFARVSPGKQKRVHARNLEILTRVLLGQVPKAVAQDMRVAISTVATGMQECLRGMGLSQRASTPPVLLMMAARAGQRSETTPRLGRLTRITAQHQSYWLVSVQRPDLEFPVSLSEAETAVVRRLISGHTHAEISEWRATSPRTVANQLASAFKKFGASGRSAILQRLITQSFERQAVSWNTELCPRSQGA